MNSSTLVQLPVEMRDPKPWLRQMNPALSLPKPYPQPSFQYRGRIKKVHRENRKPLLPLTLISLLAKRKRMALHPRLIPWKERWLFNLTTATRTMMEILSILIRISAIAWSKSKVMEMGTDLFGMRIDLIPSLSIEDEVKDDKVEPFTSGNCAEEVVPVEADDLAEVHPHEE
ncbi:hypothetical protein V6N11_038043 [Hibiscus sabdariffa]|uniref:Uncharacterized protein n=2 Tax=Hibiscus sabdariffa TaxID=183260 RepID=A0ABR1ZEK7_9ROSI